MNNDRELHEDAYEAGDGDEAFEGLDAIVGGGGFDHGDRMYGIRVDADETDEDYVDEDEQEEDAEFDEFEPEVDELVEEVDIFDDGDDGGPDGPDTLYIASEDNATGRFESFLQSGHSKKLVCSDATY